MKSISRESAIGVTALLLGSLVLTAKPSVAETLIFQIQQQAQPASLVLKQPSKGESSSAGFTEGKASPEPSALSGTAADAPRPEAEAAAKPATNYIATAYSLRGRTASGRMVSKGLIAADPSVLPLGSRVLLEAGNYTGEYLVADTGGAVRGRRIDIWTPSTREALRFGRRTVKLTVLSYGPKRAAAKTRAKA
jgi:3D (Asp-Asp-Asp) domain-containing protein